MTRLIEKSFLIYPLTAISAIYRDLLTLSGEANVFTHFTIGNKEVSLVKG